MVQKSLESSFLQGLLHLDWQLVARGVSKEFRGRFPHPNQGRPNQDAALRILQYDPDKLAPLDHQAFMDTLHAHVKPWTTVERASWRAFEFVLEPNLKRAFAKVHFQLGGPGSRGERSVVDATIEVQVIETSPRHWEIRRLDFIEGRRIENPRPPFRDITDEVGFHFNQSEANKELRQAVVDTKTNMSYFGLSVVDWNRDGFRDILATESLNQSVLFLNDGKGGFVRGELPFQDSNLCPSQFLFLDLDGDGLEELVGNRVHTYRGEKAWIGIHTRRNGKWIFLPRALEFENPPEIRRTDMQCITAGDLDGDGFIDLFLGGYENSQSRDPQRWNLVAAYDGDDNLLFINHGNLRFSEESDSRGIQGTQYTFCAQFFDFDGDGDVDLFEGNDYGPNVIWDNLGDGTFEALPNHPLARDSNYTMGVTVGDWDNTGNWSVYISNMYSHAGQRVTRLTESLNEEMHERVRFLTQGNQMFTWNRDNGQWEDQAVTLGVNRADWAWACVFYDLDNDGDKEIFVANGNTSYRDREAPDY